MFGRVRTWSRRHPGVVDTMWLAPFLLTSLWNIRLIVRKSMPGLSGNLWELLGLCLLLTVPLVWLRRHPLPVFTIVALVSFGQWLAEVKPMLFNLAVLIAMYGVVSYRRLGWAVAAGLMVELGVALALSGTPAGLTADTWAGASMYVVPIWITGIYTNTRRRYLESLEERAERAERERDQQARLATAAERARIARELHDVVAHNVSVIIVQADGAGYALDRDPEQAREAMRAISSTGRRALTEMRRMVGMLRADGTPEEYTPQPSLSQLDDLMVQVRSSGLPVGLRITGTPWDLTEGEQLVVYRIVQEALTNALKHGGPGTRATVEMEYGGRELLLRVTDSGRGAGASAAPGGHGLVGMRERAAMFGGSVEAGPCGEGGFRVVARLPASETAKSRAG